MIVITVARKPVPGSVAQTIQDYRTGGINIDACRVAVSRSDSSAMERTNTPGAGRFKIHGGCLGTFERSNPSKPLDTTQGRWPANLILQHSLLCQKIGTTETKGYVINRWEDGSKPFGGGAGHPYASVDVPSQEIDLWECIEGCPIGALDAMGIKKSGSGTVKRASGVGGENPNQCYGKESRASGEAQVAYGDIGFVSRYFKQVQE
jgi:hypothetical protein